MMYITDFKKKYPKAPTADDGTPQLCPYELGYFDESEAPCYKDDSPRVCKVCWRGEI